MKNYNKEIYTFANKVFSFPRSLTGDGVRSTLYEIKKINKDLKKIEIATGTQVFDWKVPKEWRVTNAYIIDPEGKKICEYKKKPIYHNPSTIAHRMFFFCTDIKLCMEAADDDPKLPVWVATNQNKLNIIRINGWRHDFLKPYYKKRVSYYDEETILNYYLIKHNLDGFQAAVDYDQDDSGERKYEFAFLEDVVEQKMNINNCIPLLKF